ncbi:MAG TPA: T9SS type A sorting domain-containing protein, partial [Rhodothermales bacterium]|nr:T9SS type A sorting domain-containing protein [Rhodothermales bacterium]
DATDAASTIAFAWETDATATAYHLQVSATSDFSDLAFEDDALTETTQTFGPLAYSTRHYWRVRATNDIGPGPWSEVRNFTVAVGTAVERVGEAIPTAYQLHANYPNPFNPTTTLRFDLPASSEVTLTIYDMLGREVETLVASTLAAGRYTFAWEATDRPSGLYLARLRAGRFVQTQRMMLLK